MFWQSKDRGGGMIVRRYGTTVQSVDPNFDSRAMNEIGFQKNGAWSKSWEEFQSEYQRTGGRELTCKAEGNVQHEVEDRALCDLRDQLKELDQTLGSGEVLLIESEAGKDYPKTREKQRTTVVGAENRLHFERTIDPPLRVGVYKEKAS
jgi:hypothetical protein